MRRIFMVATVLLLALAVTGCGRRIGIDAEFEGEISRTDDTIQDRLEDAEELLFAEGRPVDGGFPCAEFGLAAGKNLAIEVTSRDFDPVAVVFDSEGAIIAVSDDWEDDSDSRLVLSDIPRGARLLVFAVDGSSGEYSVTSTEASASDLEEFVAASDLTSGLLKGDLLEGKDDDLIEEAIEDELDAYVYLNGYGNARIHVFDVTEEQLVSLVLESEDFDPILVLMSVDDDEYDYVIHNDDYSGGLQSRIDEILEPGRYAAVVVPYSDGTEGSYTISYENYDLEALQAEPVQAESPGTLYNGTVTPGEGLAISVWPGITLEKPYDLLITAATPCAFFEFEVPRGGTGLYDVDASSENLDTFLCLLRIEDGYVTMIGSNDDYQGSDSRLTKMLAPGAYTALVTSYSGSESGEVQFSFQTAFVEPRPLTIDRPVDATVSWNNPELFFSLEVMAGSIYTVSVDSDEIDPWVEAVLPDGTVLSDDDGGGYPNARLRIDPTPAQSGSVMITVRDYASGSTGSLRVEVTQERRSEGEAFALYD